MSVSVTVSSSGTVLRLPDLECGDAHQSVSRLTHNEPWCVAVLGHGRGSHAPGRTSDRTSSTVGDSSTEPWMYVRSRPTLLCVRPLTWRSPAHVARLFASLGSVGHHLILSHAYACKLYREQFQGTQGGTIGITLNGDMAIPYDDSPESELPLLTRRLYTRKRADGCSGRYRRGTACARRRYR